MSEIEANRTELSDPIRSNLLGECVRLSRKAVRSRRRLSLCPPTMDAEIMWCGVVWCVELDCVVQCHDFLCCVVLCYMMLHDMTKRGVM